MEIANKRPQRTRLKHASKEDALRANKIRRQRILALAQFGGDELTSFVYEEAHRLRKLRDRYTSIRWHVDHILPLRGKFVCGFHVWNNLAVIPAEINLRKNNKCLL